MEKNILELVHTKYKISFLDKLNLLIEWTGNDEEKKNFIGFQKYENGDFKVNIPVLSNNLGIKERSLTKNFALNGYSHYKLNNFDFFTKQKRFDFLQERNKFNIFDAIKTNPLYDQMFFYWDKFNKCFPERKVSDFVNKFISKKNGWIGVNKLISLIIGSDNFDNDSFLLIFQHFGPIDSISSKISIICSSVFSRGWRFNQENVNTVNVLSNGIFLFNDGEKRIELQNDLSKNFNERWLKRIDNNQYFELEYMFEKTFPKAVQSSILMRESIEELFPD